MLRTLESCQKELYLDPSFELPADVKKLRQAMFKNELKIRLKTGCTHGQAPAPPSAAARAD